MLYALPSMLLPVSIATDLNTVFGTRMFSTLAVFWAVPFLAGMLWTVSRKGRNACKGGRGFVWHAAHGCWTAGVRACRWI